MFESRSLNGVDEDLAKKRFEELQHTLDTRGPSLLNQFVNSIIVIAMVAIIIAGIYIVRFN